MAKTSKDFKEGQVVSFNWRGARQGIVVGSRGSMTFVFADFGEGLGFCCKRVFVNTLFAGTQEPCQALIDALKKWAKVHHKALSPFVADIAEAKAKAKEADSKGKGLDIQALAKGLASGGLTPEQIAQVINLVR